MLQAAARFVDPRLHDGSGDSGLREGRRSEVRVASGAGLLPRELRIMYLRSTSIDIGVERAEWHTCTS